ncbi:hypothetical protein Tco_0794770 [Tanacetum coccineum]
MASSQSQSILDAGTENCHPMLVKGSYIPWASRFMQYIDGKKELGKMINDLINNGSYQMKMTEADLTPDEKTRFEADIDVMNAILLGTELSQQDTTSRLVDEFHKFKCMSEESIGSYYQHFSKIMNDLECHLILPTTIASNTKFLNSLQPEWKKYVTMVRQTNNLHEVDFDPLFDYLKQNEEIMNESRAKRASRTHDPLVLVANSYTTPSSSHVSQPYYVTHPPSENDSEVDTQSYDFQS